jgi:hypothetical protein
MGFFQRLVLLHAMSRLLNGTSYIPYPKLENTQVIIAKDSFVPRATAPNHEGNDYLDLKYLYVSHLAAVLFRLFGSGWCFAFVFAGCKTIGDSCHCKVGVSSHLTPYVH